MVIGWTRCIEPYVVGFGQMIEKIWTRRAYMYLW